MTQYDAAYSAGAERPNHPTRMVYPIRQTGYFNGAIGAGGAVYIQPVRQTAAANATDWLVVDRGIFNAVIMPTDPFGGCSLYIYLSPTGAVGDFAQTHIFYCPGGPNATQIAGLELFGFTATFRLHSPTAQTVKAFLNLRSV